MAGYSATPLAQKLGIKPGATLLAIKAPANYRKLLGPSSKKIRFTNRAGRNENLIHLFADRRRFLEEKLGRLRPALADTGVLWVSWPKKSSGVSTDVTEDVVRTVALPLGLVDVKVCAVDEIWSGLKLMVRREQRKTGR